MRTLVTLTPADIIGTSTSLAPPDLTAIVAWVTSKRDSAHTRRAFRIEAQRWLAWLIWVKAGSGYTTFLDKARPIDAAAYAQFLKMAPKPDFPDWALQNAGLHSQPFRQERDVEEATLGGAAKASKPMATASVERAISALKAMYADLVVMTAHEPFTIVANPFARFKVSNLVRKASPRAKGLNAIERGYVDQSLSLLQSTGNLPLYHQCRWIWAALKWTAMRRSELARATAGDVFQDTDEAGNTLWMLSVLGKGNKQDAVPLADVFMEEMRVYRQYHGLPAVPVFGIDGQPEQTPLVIPMTGPVRQMNDKVIYRIMKDLMARAAEVAMTDGNPAAAGRLRTFAAHSARHTSITTLVDATGDITLGQDFARHGSIVTTRMYKAKSVSRLKDALQSLNTL